MIISLTLKYILKIFMHTICGYLNQMRREI
jgi:hypothetical protein